MSFATLVADSEVTAHRGGGFDWSAGNIVIALIVIVLIVGILLIVLKNSGVALPPWVWQIIGLVALGVVAIVAVKILLSL